MFFLTRPSAARIEAILEQARADTPNYGEVGATQRGETPPGYHGDTYWQPLGDGDRVWQRACDGLRAWVPHRGAGAEILPTDAPLEEGTSLAVLLRPGPIFAAAICRIVYVVDEPDRFGFAYGTLPGHPEQGEESFIVERRGDDVMFRVDVFSRPAELLARIGAPVTRLIQKRVTRQYLTSLQEFCAGI